MHYGYPANYGAHDLVLAEDQVYDLEVHIQSLLFYCLALLPFCTRGGGKGCQLPWIDKNIYKA